MAFNKYNLHCTQCKKGKPCGKRHVYALDLDKAVLEEPWFRKMNPDYEDGKDCVYVGMTGHLPKCRASAHQLCKRGAWSDKKFICYCEGKGKRISCTLGSRAARKRVDKYNTCYLKKNLFRRYNPQENQADSRGMELFLAKHLRSKGYGVYVDEDKEEEGSEAGTQKDQGVPKSFLDAILDATS
jgi:hypothetical protein